MGISMEFTNAAVIVTQTVSYSFIIGRIKHTDQKLCDHFVCFF